MRRLVRTTTTLLAVLAAGCGGGSSGGGSGGGAPASNDAKIHHAEQAESSASDLHAKLDTALRLHHYAGVDDVYELSNGGRCDIDGIYVGDQAQIYANESNALVSPDGNAVVEVGFFEGTPTSQCMQAAKDALGW